MAKKIIAVLLAVILIVGVMSVFTACNDTNNIKIVFLGDSIAEAVLGPSPLSEREYYGYYALIGKRNNYTYVNRAVSGHKTSAMLDYISKEDGGALMTKTHIQTADIIQVSILGNDMLQEDVTGLFIEFAKWKAGEIATEDTKREKILIESRENFAKIIAKLKELNPTAKLFIQTVYNPVYDGNPLIGQRARDILPEYGYVDEGTGPNSYRALGKELLQTLNDVIYDYHAEHPDDFYIVDVFKAFDDIYNKDSVRGQHLMYPDGTHPSNEGHAVIADTTQHLLEELKLAGSSALKNEKQLRLDQLKRLYPELYKNDGAKKDIYSCTSIDEITEVYFRAIDGQVPKLN